MVDNPKEPSFLDPEQPESRPQEPPAHAGEMDELRKKLTTESLSGKNPEERPNLIQRITRPLTGALNRLRGTSSLKMPDPTDKTGRTGKLPPQELRDSDFDRVLPAGGISLAGEEIPSDEEAPPEFHIAPEDLATGSALKPQPDLPFDSTLDDLSSSGEYEEPAESPWPFDDSLTHPKEEDLPAPLDKQPRFFPTGPQASDDSSQIDQFLDKPAEPDKGRGWKSIVTDLLGRAKQTEPHESASDFDIEDSAMARRLGLSGEGEEATQPTEDHSSDSAESLYEQDEGAFPIYQPPAGPSWYEQRPEFFPEINEDDFANLQDDMKWGSEGSETLTWPPDHEDLLQNLQAEREELLEDLSEGTRPSPGQAPEGSSEEHIYNTEQVADFWNQGVGESAETDLPKNEFFNSQQEELSQTDFAADDSFENLRDMALEEYEEELPGADVMEDDSFDSLRDVALEEYEEDLPGADSMEDVSLDSMRGVVLEEYESGETSGETAAAPLEKSGWLGLNRTEIIILAMVSALLVIVVGAGLFLQFNRATVRPTELPPVATDPVQEVEGPYPTGIELTGGWYFPLNPSTVIQGKWQPKGPEWLRGSEIRRMVALPWNRQLEAVIISLVPGDTLNLSFSNGEKLVYQVDRVERMMASSTSQLEDLSPSLLIVLALEDSTDRWLITCTPVEIP